MPDNAVLSTGTSQADSSEINKQNKTRTIFYDSAILETP
jgi:hypothetical protein